MANSGQDNSIFVTIPNVGIKISLKTFYLFNNTTYLCAFIAFKREIIIMCRHVSYNMICSCKCLVAQRTLVQAIFPGLLICSPLSFPHDFALYKKIRLLTLC